MKRNPFSIALLHPRYWGVWLGVGLWALITHLLPFRALMWLGGKLGRAAGHFSQRRQRTARKNIALCFPEKTPQQREELFWKVMESTGRGFVDTGIAWFWPAWRLNKVLDVRGMEHLFEAHRQGQGVLLFTFHFTSLEAGAAGVNGLYPHMNHGVYRAHANRAYDYIQRKGRERHTKKLKAVRRDDVRSMVRALRKGAMMIYLPDQDYGRKHSVFVPFFGVEAATVVAPSQLVKMGRAKVMAFTAIRKEDGSGYLSQVYPAFENYGQGDQEADARMLNDFLEARIREHPDQYLWVHRRFKTRPDGNRDFYELGDLRSSKRRQKRRSRVWQQKREAIAARQQDQMREAKDVPPKTKQEPLADRPEADKQPSASEPKAE